MKEIQLTQGKVALVDDADYEWLNQWKWCANKAKSCIYAARTWRENGKKITRRLHTEIMGKKEGLEIDHINGNKLDNRKENLRFVTRRQNMQNLHTIRASKYPGVGWHNHNKKWRARIKTNGKEKLLGYYTNEEDAFKAYCDAVNELGEIILKNEGWECTG